MKTIDDINLHTWFMDRELAYVPEHFTVSKTPVTSESKAWILETLIGRFSLCTSSSSFMGGMLPAFEDSKEALFYELTWA